MNKNMSSYEIKQACCEAFITDDLEKVQAAVEWLHVGDVRDLAQMASEVPQAQNCFVYFLQLLEKSPSIVTNLLCECARHNNAQHIEKYLQFNKLSNSHPSYTKILLSAVRHGSLETVNMMTNDVPAHLCSTAMISALEGQQTDIVNLLSERTPKDDVPHIFYECVSRAAHSSEEYLLFLDEKISHLDYSDFVPTFKKIHPLLKVMKMENIQARHVKNQLERSIVRAIDVAEPLPSRARKM